VEFLGEINIKCTSQCFGTRRKESRKKKPTIGKTNLSNESREKIFWRKGLRKGKQTGRGALSDPDVGWSGSRGVYREKNTGLLPVRREAQRKRHSCRQGAQYVKGETPGGRRLYRGKNNQHAFPEEEEEGA